MGPAGLVSEWLFVYYSTQQFTLIWDLFLLSAAIMIFCSHVCPCKFQDDTQPG